jgi:hypothetical protein
MWAALRMCSHCREPVCFLEKSGFWVSPLRREIQEVHQPGWRADPYAALAAIRRPDALFWPATAMQLISTISPSGSAATVKTVRAGGLARSSSNKHLPWLAGCGDPSDRCSSRRRWKIHACARRTTCTLHGLRSSAGKVFGRAASLAGYIERAVGQKTRTISSIPSRVTRRLDHLKALGGERCRADTGRADIRRRGGIDGSFQAHK